MYRQQHRFIDPSFIDPGEFAITKNPQHSHTTTALAAQDLRTELLAIAREAAAAGAAVLALRGSGKISADTKSAAGDWVTDFDRRAERAVRDVIAAKRPHDEITGEEYGKTVPANPSGYRWSIDPLDGTANFVRGIVYYCTSVAVMGPETPGSETKTWLAGAVNAPALSTEYYAATGHGAWLLEQHHGVHSKAHSTTSGASARQLHGPNPAEPGKLLASGFGYDADRRQFQVGALLGLMPGYANMRRLGSAALDLCLVADGTLDAYAEYGTQEFDWAAGALIAQEAGLPVLRPTTNPGWQAAGHLDFAALPQP
ncbi:inositol monophosphatase [Arthrobacter sp. MYb227]|uniref:inositol monophosphatase family protein n=1 Tax=Arthrobacter sp. MYb227 TaxID=1848601 RepID=UPI000CFDCB66|nr:inositol monophosphatase family protein [Arthrobacter sp. MYb227]PQZ91140.1 inositol monophosphatase [Arthrobacter sp. MYb227]